MIKIDKIKLSVTNVYLLRSELGSILIDTGYFQDASRLLKFLDALGAGKLDLIVLTHGHADHAGAAPVIREKYGAKILIAKADAAMLASGSNLHLTATSFAATLYKPYLNKKFPAYNADILIEAEYDLNQYGIPGKVIPWPGHTPGSSIVLLDDGNVFIGDIIRAGLLGGLLWPGKPLKHYYSDNVSRDIKNLGDILAQFKPEKLFLGHGGPVLRDDALKFIARR